MCVHGFSGAGLGHADLVFKNSLYRRRKNYSRFLGGHFLIHVLGSRHVQLAEYSVFDEESDLQVKHKQILEPEGKINNFIYLVVVES